MANNFTDQSENGLALLIFNRTSYAAMGLVDSTGPTTFYLSLHSADPGEAGDATAYEVSGLTGYARKPLTRSSGSGGITVSAGIGSNASAIVFTITAGTPVLATYAGLSIYASGAGALFAKGLISSGGVTLGNGITATCAIGAFTFEIS